jgi:hypothetical protein
MSSRSALSGYRQLPLAGIELDNGVSTFADPAFSNNKSLPGVGTTLVEAVLHGHSAVGFEINPYAALASELKANAHQVNTDTLREEIARFREFYQATLSTDYVPHSSYPAGFRTRSAFYSPRVLHKVLIVWDFIETIQDTRIRDLLRLAFTSTMVRQVGFYVNNGALLELLL